MGGRAVRSASVLAAVAFFFVCYSLEHRERLLVGQRMRDWGLCTSSVLLAGFVFWHLRLELWTLATKHHVFNEFVSVLPSLFSFPMFAELQR